MNTAHGSHSAGRHLRPLFHRLLALSLGLAALAVAGPEAAWGQTRSAQRASAFTYDSATGLLQSEVIEPSTAALCSRTSYARDSFGNVTAASVSDCSSAGGQYFATRTTRSEYAAYTVAVGAVTVSLPAGVHATAETNALGQRELRRSEPAFGNLVQQTDPNGLVTRRQFDAFGRLTLEVTSDGTEIHHRSCYLSGAGRDLSSNGSGCTSSGFAPALAVSYVETQERDPGGEWGPAKRKYMDALGRVIRQVEQPFEGEGVAADARIVQDTVYNTYGAVVRTTTPYLSAPTTAVAAESNAAVGWTSADYDALGRPLRAYVRDDAGSTTRFGVRAALTTFQYDGLRVTERTTRSGRDASGTLRSNGELVTIRISNPLGQVEQVVDGMGAALRRKHDPFGNVVETRDAYDNRLVATFNIRGHRTELVDPNAGRWQYAYNALGELVEQRSPNQLAAGTRTTLSYDTLGRLVKRVEPEYTTSWSYDKYASGATCNAGVGRLCEVTTSHGLSRRWTFDAKGRPTEQRQTISPEGVTFVTGSSYDARGNLARQVHPSGVALEYSYTRRGFLSQIWRVASSARSMVWTLKRTDSRGQPLEYVLGATQQTTRLTYDPLTGRQTGVTAGDASGNILNQTYAWDSVGNLTRRTDRYAASNSLTETFEYDLVNRLTGYQVSSPGISGGSRQVGVTYDAIGNILFKSDVGTYTYPTSGTTSVRPGAVMRVTGSAGTRTYTYDAAGNLTSATGSQYGSVQYTSFNLPTRLTGSDGGYTWKYGPDHERIQEVRLRDNRITWYHHPDNAGTLAYEREGNTHRHYVMAMGRVVQMFESQGTSITKTQWWHADHLGSVAAITNEQYQLVQRFSYDPFGKRREISGASSTTVLRFDYPTATDRGFTGHEHLDDVGVIHMNGRTYDPHIGRFMQPDPAIQETDNLQNYNRYSYVLNNPLNATDPSGHLKLSKVLRIALAIGAGFYLGQWVMAFGEPYIAAAIAGSGTCTAAGAATAAAIATNYAVIGGMIGGFSAGALAGGSFDAGLLGAGSGLAFAAVGANTVAGSVESYLGHAVAGCVSGAASGGRCGRSAVSAVAGKFGSNISDGNFIVAIVAGGTASVLGGEKFGNGVLTAAFGYLFNHCGSNACARDDGDMQSPESNRQGLEDTDGDRAGLIANGALLGATGVSAAVGPAIASGVYHSIGGMSLVRYLGAKGEMAVGWIGPKESISYLGKTYIADGVTHATVNEVKNVAKLSLTRQIRAFGDLAVKTDRKFNLWIRHDTVLSQPLRNYVNSIGGQIRYIPGY